MNERDLKCPECESNSVNISQYDTDYAICGFCGRDGDVESFDRNHPGWQSEEEDSVSDSEIIERIKKLGIDAQRLKGCLDQKDNWGDMIHAFEYLTVLGVVCDAMVKEES